MAKQLTLDDALQMICNRAEEMWNNPKVREHVLKSIEKPITEEKIKEFMFNAALYTLYVPVSERKRMADRGE